MIRDRRPEDLDRLIEIVGALDGRAEVLHGRTARGWLEERSSSRSWTSRSWVPRAWVFDQAPVTAAPTRNVVGHLQMYGLDDTPWGEDVLHDSGWRADDLVVIGRLFVKPSKHQYGIARYLLTESVKVIEANGCCPVLEPADHALVPAGLPDRLGFANLRRDTSQGPPILARSVDRETHLD